LAGQENSSYWSSQANALAWAQFEFEKQKYADSQKNKGGGGDNKTSTNNTPLNDYRKYTYEELGLTPQAPKTPTNVPSGSLFNVNYKGDTAYAEQASSNTTPFYMGNKKDKEIFESFY
jgi:hypothetical protein